MKKQIEYISKSRKLMNITLQWQAYASENVILNGGVTVNSWNQALDSYLLSFFAFVFVSPHLLLFHQAYM